MGVCIQKAFFELTGDSSEHPTAGGWGSQCRGLSPEPPALAPQGAGAPSHLLGLGARKMQGADYASPSGLYLLN